MNQFSISGTSALAPIETFSPVLVQKPAPVVAVGSVISYRWVNQCFERPILAILYDRFNRVSHYVVPSLFPTHTTFTQLAATDTVHIERISEPKPMSNADWYLWAAWQAYEQAAFYRHAARKCMPRVDVDAQVLPLKTAKGYGFHHELETEYVAGNEGKYAYRMKRAAQHEAIYKEFVQIARKAA